MEVNVQLSSERFREEWERLKKSKGKYFGGKNIRKLCKR